MSAFEGEFRNRLSDEYLNEMSDNDDIVGMGDVNYVRALLVRAWRSINQASQWKLETF